MTRKRVRRTRVEWSALVSDVEASGQSMSAYSRDHGVSLASLAYWRKKLASGNFLARSATKGKAVFSEVVVVPRASAQRSRIEVVTRGGAAIRIEGAFDASVLRSAASGRVVLTFPAGVRLYLATAATDLRRSFDGLSAAVQSEFGMAPTSGDLFIFLNRRATQVRILFRDRDGYCVLMKRLEQGTFRRVKSADGVAHVEVDAGELAMLLEGIDAPVVKRRKRFKLPNAAE